MADDDPVLLRPRRRGRATVRALAALAIVAAFGWAIRGQWPEVRKALVHLNGGWIAPALLLGVASLGATMLAWRSLLTDLGSPISVGAASRIFFVGQLGKYLPGSVWPVVVQMELGRDIGLPRKRVALVSLLTIGLGSGAAGLIALATVPLFVSHRYEAWGWAGPALVLPAVWVLLSPGLVNRGLSAAIRLIRRDPDGVRLSPAGLRGVMGWSLLSFLCVGGQAYALLLALHAHGPHLLLRAIGAFAVAVVVGIAVIVAPAGLGPREALLVGLLSPALPVGRAAALAVLSRGVLSVADLLVAGMAWLSARRQRRGAQG